MIQEKYFDRFHLILFRFVTSIILLVISPNLIACLIGWDGLGVSSYFLVIYYGRAKSYNAGIITALTNRLGDGFIIVALTLLIPIIDLRFFWYTNFWNSGYLIIILILGCFTKRAQIPFSSWLPAAIAAPTPVSSLVHSSTLVTAGVYILIRHLGAFRMGLGIFVRLVGALTIIIARISAFFERDIKKIIALSTLSQLGVIVCSIGINLPILRFIHLIAHAFFKAILFISTGNLIHSRSDYQALKKSGKLLKILPCSFAANTAGSLSLAGLPFISAFFSKEPILESCIGINSRVVIYFLIVIGVSLTVGYRVRLIVLTGVFLNNRVSLKREMESTKASRLSILMLYPLAVIGAGLVSLFMIEVVSLSFTPLINKIFVIRFLVIGLFIGVGASIIKIKKYKFYFKYLSIWSMPFFSTIVLNYPGQNWGGVNRRMDNVWIWYPVRNVVKINLGWSSLVTRFKVNQQSLLVSVVRLIVLIMLVF